MMSRLENAVKDLSGKFVVLSLFTTRGVEQNLRGQIAGAGPGGFTMIGVSFPWPTTVRYSQVHSIREDAPGFFCPCCAAGTGARALPGHVCT